VWVDHTREADDFDVPADFASAWASLGFQGGSARDFQRDAGLPDSRDAILWAMHEAFWPDFVIDCLEKKISAVVKARIIFDYTAFIQELGLIDGRPTKMELLHFWGASCVGAVFPAHRLSY
jgi:hypothetical protein